jgi:hypothetical protein
MSHNSEIQKHIARVSGTAMDATPGPMPAGFAERVLARRPAWEKEQREISLARMAALGALASLLVVAFTHFQMQPTEHEPAFVGWLEMEPLDEPVLWE